MFRLCYGNPGGFANGIEALYVQLEWRMWDRRDQRMSLSIARYTDVHPVRTK
jgi:hypothetical protein